MTSESLEKVRKAVQILEMQSRTWTFIRKFGRDIKEVAKANNAFESEGKSGGLWPINVDELNQFLAFVNNMEAQSSDNSICLQKAAEFAENFVGKPVYIHWTIEKQIIDCGCEGPYTFQGIVTLPNIACVTCEKEINHTIDIRDLEAVSMKENMKL